MTATALRSAAELGVRVSSTLGRLLINVCIAALHGPKDIADPIAKGGDTKHQSGFAEVYWKETRDGFHRLCIQQNMNDPPW